MRCNDKSLRARLGIAIFSECSACRRATFRAVNASANFRISVKNIVLPFDFDKRYFGFRVQWRDTPDALLVEYSSQIAPYSRGGEELLKACRPAVGLHLFFRFSSMNSKIGFSLRLIELQTPNRSRQASNGLQ